MTKQLLFAGCRNEIFWGDDFFIIFFDKFLMKINFQLLMVLMFLVLNLNECYQNHEKKLSVGHRN